MPVREFRNIGGGVAFHPTRDIVFGIDNFTDEVVAYDTKTYAELFRSTSGDVFFQTPLFMSGDGRYLAWSTANGIRLFNLPASFVTPTPPPPSLTEVQSVVFDHSGKYLYAATTSGAVHKYDYGAQTIVQTYSLGGSLNSIDVSPDDSFLLVAQAYEGLIQGICHKIDIRAGQISDFHYPRTPVYEPEGVTGVAFASAKRAFFTAAGGPWQIDLLTNQITSRNQPAVNGSTVISHSGDYSRLFFALARLAGTNNPTEGSFETYETLTDSFSAPLILTNREFDNPAFSIDRTGNLLATKQGRSVSIDSAAGFKYVHTLTGIDGGITFDPTSVGHEGL
jgi:WD40 repeat protein